MINLLEKFRKYKPGHTFHPEYDDEFYINEIIGIDDCKCGNLGKYFLIHGRAERAEIRGCSDTVK